MARLRDSWPTSLPVAQQPRKPQPESIARTPYHTPLVVTSPGEAVLGWLLMSERGLRRVEVLSSVVARRMTVTAAAAVLGVSRRQAHRLLKAYRAEGAAALRYQAR